jgi:DNA-binding transcriptional MerR regulator
VPKPGVDVIGPRTIGENETVIRTNHDEMSLDELTTASGLSIRTIRFYQAQGILTAPRKVGRVAKYNTTHIEQLAQITELQEQGFKIEAIKRFTGKQRQRRSLTDLLRLDAALHTKWIDDEPTRFTQPEIIALLKPHPNRLIDELINELVEANLLQRQPDTTLIAPSPAILELALQMLDADVSIKIAAKAAALLRRRLAKAADDLVELFATETGQSFAGNGTPEEISNAITAIRPVALEGARVILAQEFEWALHQRKPGTRK